MGSDVIDQHKKNISLALLGGAKVYEGFEIEKSHLRSILCSYRFRYFSKTLTGQ